MAGRGTELAVGYISLVAETSGLTKDVDKAFSQVSRKAEQHGRKMGEGASKGASKGFKFKPDFNDGLKQADSVGRGMGQRMAGALGSTLAQGLATAGIAGGLAGVAAAFTSAIRSGVQYESQLNRIQGVTAATAEQMAAVNAKARELGNDVTLTGVSAQTAAAGMLELTKGGLSVEQAMEAARGTMALATAAGVEAGKAATIQADAINAFALSAKDASKVADNLANVANASTGEMADFAYGLQMSSAVANQFGMTVDETVTSLGLLANAGVKGSDAGTLIKTMLLHLGSPQSERASDAIAKLGLTVWDSSGKFVGMAQTLEELHQASRRMTPEMYAMYSSAALGSDAARMAGVAARTGAAGFNEMLEAVNQVGGATRLAASNTQGLPGVLERLSNTADRAKMTITDLARGPLMALGDALNTGINNALDDFEAGAGAFGTLKSMLSEVWPVVRDMGEAFGDAARQIASGAWGVFATTLGNIAEVLNATLVPALKFISESGVGKVIATAGAAWAAWKVASPILGGIHTGIGKVHASMAKAVTPVRNLVTEFHSMKAAAAFVQGRDVSRWGQALMVLENHSPLIHSVADGYRSAASHGGHFTRTLGVMRGAMAGVHHVGSNLVGMLGGPWGAALTAATIGVTLWTQSMQQAKARADLLEQTTNAMTEASNNMYEAFTATGGEVDETVVSAVDDQVQALSRSMNELRRGAGAGDWLRHFSKSFTGIDLSGGVDAFEIQKTAEAHERMADVMQELKLDYGQVSAAVRGSSNDWAALQQRLSGAGDAGSELLGRLQPLRDEFLKNQEAAKNLTPGIKELESAIDVLGDSASTTADKSSALKRALDILAGKAPDAAAAQRDYYETMERLGNSANQVADAAGGMGEALEDASGGLDMQQGNARDLLDTLRDMRDATADVAAAGEDLGPMFEQNAVLMEMLSKQYGVGIEKVREWAETLAGYDETSMRVLVAVDDDEAKQDIKGILLMLDQVGEGETITVNPPGPEAENALKDIGVELDYIDVKGKPQIEISMNGDVRVKDQVRGILDAMTNIPSSLTITSSLTQRNTAFRNSIRESARSGDYLPVGPRAGGLGGGWPAGRADGGSISGPGTATSDSVPILASNGEHMWSAAEVAGAGGHHGVENLRALARHGALRGLLPGFKDGGGVGDSKKRTTDEWLSDIADEYGGGGSGTDIESALWYAYDQNGRPYEYGGTGQGGSSFDCSGYLSSTWGVMTGLGPGRHFSTDSDFAALGFLPGYKAGAFNIGTNGGSGKNGHMAGTLPDGSHIESGASGVVYDGEVGALDPQFTQHWYYPVSADDPAVQRLAASGWGRNASYSEGGNTTYSQGGASGAAQQSAAEAMGYAPGAGADMARTEGWVPVGAGSTGVAGTSFAAGLLGMGAEAINGLIDQAASAASSAASMGVNAIAPGAGGAAGAATQFAVGLGTSAAKRGVSYGFQMASIGLDALVEQLTPLGAPRWLGYDYTSLVPQIGMQPAPLNVAEQAALAQRQDEAIRPPQGVSASAWEQRLGEHWDWLPSNFGGSQQPSQHGMGMGQQPGPPASADPWGTASATSAPPATQPGAAGGQQDWLRSIGLFDEGGMLPSGGAAINLSGSPEPVLTSGQWNTLSRATESLHSGGMPGPDYSIRIDNVQVQDVAALQRELDARQKLQMMRYAGRP